MYSFCFVLEFAINTQPKKYQEYKNSKRNSTFKRNRLIIIIQRIMKRILENTSKDRQTKAIEKKD
jgi:hypothetical protein